MAGARVLLVDDDWLSRKIYSDFLAEEKHETVTVGSAHEALELLDRQTFDVVVTDLVMPEMDGLELVDRVVLKCPDVSILLLTGHASVDTAVAALKSGALDYLVKPVSAETLRLAVRRSLEHARLLRENKDLRRYLRLYEASQRLSLCIESEKLGGLALDTMMAASRSVAGWIVDPRTPSGPPAVVRGFSEAALPALGDLSSELLALPFGSNGMVVEPRPSHWGPKAKLLEAFGRSVVARGDVRGEAYSYFVLLGGPNQDALRDDEVADLSFLRIQIGRALENAEKHLGAKRLAYLDDLTKLYNQTYLEVVLNREIGLATADESRVFSLLFLDLDNFKLVNDEHGHLNGSRVLIELSRVLQRTVREFDLVFRFGGDEYVLYLHDCGSGGAMNVGKRICDRIARHPFLAREGLTVSLTASIGVASFPEHAKTREDLLRLADQAMYAVKRATRNGVYLANTIEA